MRALTLAGVIAVRSSVPVWASVVVAILILPLVVSLASGTEAAPPAPSQGLAPILIAHLTRSWWR